MSSLIRKILLFLIPAVILFIPEVILSPAGTTGNLPPLPRFTMNGDGFKDSQKEFIHSVLQKTMNAAKRLIDHGVNGNDKSSSLDPLNLDTMWMIFKEENGFLNASLQKTKLRGLSKMSIKDIASNLHTKRSSVLLHFPELEVTGVYRVKGAFKTPKREVLEDMGVFQMVIKDVGASWSAKLLSMTNNTLEVTQMAVKSYHDGMSSKFQSYNTKTPTPKSQEILDAIASSLVEKVISILEETMMDIMTKLVKVTHFPQKATHPLLEFHSQYKSHPISKRQIPCMNGEELDEYVDSLFRFASRFIRSMEPISLPNATVEIWDYNLVLFFYDGAGTRTYQVSRKKPAWVVCTNNTITLGVALGFEDLRINYKYKVIQDWRLLFKGDADISVTNSKIQIQMTQTMMGEDDVRQNLDRLRIWRLGKVRVILRGLGNLTSALSMLLTQMINENPQLIIDMVESQAQTMVNRMLANLTIPIFSLI